MNRLLAVQLAHIATLDARRGEFVGHVYEPHKRTTVTEDRAEELHDFARACLRHVGVDEEAYDPRRSTPLSEEEIDDRLSEPDTDTLEMAVLAALDAATVTP